MNPMSSDTMMNDGRSEANFFKLNLKPTKKLLFLN